MGQLALGLYLGIATCALAPAMAYAQPSLPDSAGAAVEEAGDIIVTATRREERAQSVPSTFSVANSEALLNANVTSALQIGKLVPGVLFQPAQGKVFLFIRGIGSSLNAFGAEKSNATYIDGVFYPQLAPVDLRLNSIERIEVLKGPQGTLFGRNSTGGLIQIITREPRPGRTSAEFGLGYGNYGTVDSNAYVATGIGANVAADLSVVYHDQTHGWGRNLTTGGEAFKEREFLIRSKWVFTPTASSKVVAIGNYNQANGDTSILRYYFPTTIATGVPGSTALEPIPPRRFDTFANFPNYFKPKSYGGSLRIEQEFGFATLVSITAYQRNDLYQSMDTDRQAGSYNHVLQLSTDKRWTQELQLLSPRASRFQWTLGAFYIDEKYANPYVDLTGSLNRPAGGTLHISSAGLTRSLALYGQTTVPLTEQISLTVGLRYSWDRLNGEGLIDAINTAGAVTPLVPFSSSSVKNEKLLWKGTIDYKPSDDFMLYGTISRGSKGSVYQLVTFNPVPVEPETLDDYEVGFKSSLLDRKLRLNGALFYYQIKDLQVQQTSSLGTVQFVNGPKAKVKGAELELDATITPNFTVRAAGAYLDAEYTSFPGAQTYFPRTVPPFGYLPAVGVDAKGNRLARAPRFSGNISARYSIPSSMGEWSLSGSYAYTGKFYFSENNQNFQRSYGILDARLALALDRGVTVSVWGNNLTDAKYYNHAIQFGNSIGDAGVPGAPRTYGLRIDYKY